MYGTLSLNEYQHRIRRFQIYGKEHALQYLSLSLAGEAGEAAGKIGKIYRDNGGVMSREVRDAVLAELGDVLFMVAALAEYLGESLEGVAMGNVAKLQDRKDRGVIGGSGDKR